MFSTILTTLVVLIAAVLAYAATKPDSFRVERSIAIKAPAARIFPLINDLRTMQTWSAWAKIDPAMKITYSGPGSGKGAVYEWSGNKQIGEGRMEIMESSPLSKLVMKLNFTRPMVAENTVEFTLQPDGDFTRVTQTIYGPSPYISKVMGILCNMDKMIGSKFEQGLADMKALAEK